jgi:CBS domain-containing protein/anti-sigma regulatory factor (Ser/Thr protein kinase)
MSEDFTKIQEIFYELRVGEVMTPNVITVTPRQSMGDLEELLRVHRISGAPVIEDGALVGIVSLQDLIKALEAGQIDQPVSAWMTHQVQVLYTHERVISAIQKLEKTGYGRFPVVDYNTGQLAGMLTQGDIIKGTLKELDIHYRRREQEYSPVRHIFEDVVSENTSITLQYTVKALDFDHGGQASSQFKRSLQNLGISPGVLRRAAIATYEAETNLMLHTIDGGQIEAVIRPDKIRIDFVDDGPGIPDVEQAMQPGFSTASEWIREMGFGAGMGLSNIKTCADEMSLESEVGKGTHLWVLFRLDHPPAGT